jgi:hypothetical protein
MDFMEMKEDENVGKKKEKIFTCTVCVAKNTAMLLMPLPTS